MSAAAYTARTALGGANSRCAAEFGILALGVLGVDGGRSCVRIPLCSGFPNAAGWNAEQGRQADEKLTAFLELESAIRAVSVELSVELSVLRNRSATQPAPQRSQAE